MRGGLPAALAKLVCTKRAAADTAALAALFSALAALFALGVVFVVEPVIVAIQGPDPCAVSTAFGQPDPACFNAHPGYYQCDPAAGSCTTPGARISKAVDPVAWPAALALALVSVVVGWLARAMGTGRRRLALTALTLGSLILATFTVVVFLALALGGGD